MYIYMYICIYTCIYVYVYIYIYIAISKLFCFMQNIVYFICDVYLLILWQTIIIFDFVHNNNETIKYYASCFKQEKYYINYIVFCRMECLFFFFSFKNMLLKNMAIHMMYIFTKNITTHRGKEWNIYFLKIIS